MQAFLDGSALKPLTKALTCLAKYGEEVTIYATPETFSLSTTNSSMSARTGTEHADVVPAVTGQLMVKSLLLILKHRSSDKTVEKCELSIQEGSDDASEEADGLESRLLIRLFCKHGVTKTHRLIISPPQSLLAPEAPDPEQESQLTIGPLAMRDLISHFPAARNAKSDPQLKWSFDYNEFRVSSFESSLDSRGSAHVSTAITIPTGEFDAYYVRVLPITIAFHLREFNASIGYAESMSLPLDLRFTDPTAPLFIDVEADDIETLFVISTTQVSGGAQQTRGAKSNSNSNGQQSSQSRKRPREPSSDGASVPGSTTRAKRPLKAVHRVDLPTPSRATPSRTSMGPPSSLPMRPPSMGPPSSVPNRPIQEALFLPSLSQLSVQEQQSMEDAGLAGVTNMEDFDELFNDNGLEEEINGFGGSSQFAQIPDGGASPFANVPDGEDMVFAPTQEPNVERAFKSLFDD